jgi:PAS domain-containing protein
MAKKKKQAASPVSFDTLMESLPIGLAVLELPEIDDESTWNLAHINSRAGYLVEHSAAALLSPDLLQHPGAINLPAAYREVLQYRQIKPIGLLRNPGPIQRPTEFSLMAFPLGERRVGILFQDFTFQVEALRQRSEDSLTLREISGMFRIILWRANPQTLRISEVTREAEMILGYWVERWCSEADFLRKHIHPEDREEAMAAITKVASDGRQCTVDFRMIDVDKKEVYFHAIVRASKDVLGVRELACVMAEVTELRDARNKKRARFSSWR